MSRARTGRTGDRLDGAGDVVRVVDGDTVIMNLDLGWRVYGNEERIRVNARDIPGRSAVRADVRDLLRRGGEPDA